MSDFIIQFGNATSPTRIQDSLQNRPWMERRAVHIVEYAWGQIVLQEPASQEFRPYKTEETFVG